jgi:diaminohydroxyphosphoribosylaminopyrimidine deaminase/5-amino-6-(5-phosphoribosylamino)uracil reductase
MAAGHPHAEVAAIAAYPGTAYEALCLYVTLEPCAHHGRTPPCVEAIIAAGIGRVVFAYRDPNPQVAGRGQRMLQAAGISCEQTAVPAIDFFYRSYAHWVATGRPWVTVKMAMTADGYCATAAGQPLQITGEAANQLTHQTRAQADAILTTAQTVLADDPQLNARLPSGTVAKPVYVLDRACRLTAGRRLENTAASLTCYHARAAHPPSAPLAARYQAIAASEQYVSLAAVLTNIGLAGTHDLWVEAGPTLLATLHAGGWINALRIYRSPHALGEPGLRALPSALDLSNAHWVGVGEDTLTELTFF